MLVAASVLHYCACSLKPGTYKSWPTWRWNDSFLLISDIITPTMAGSAAQVRSGVWSGGLPCCGWWRTSEAPWAEGQRQLAGRCSAWRGRLQPWLWGSVTVNLSRKVVRVLGRGSSGICSFSNSKTHLGITQWVFNPEKFFCTFFKATASEKTNMCVDRCLRTRMIFVFSGSKEM